MGGWWGGGGRLFEAGRLLSFSAFRMGAYSRWALIRGWALIRINTVKGITDAFYGCEGDKKISWFCGFIFISKRRYIYSSLKGIHCFKVGV